MSASPFRRTSTRRAALVTAAALAGGVTATPAPARAEVPVLRTFFRLPSSNGHGAVMLDLAQARATHFREHLFASEEPQLDGSGNEVWLGNQPQSVKTRDLLYDAYFGLRSAGDQRWLTTLPVDLDASGFASWSAGKTAGTGVARMVQKLGSLDLEQLFFAPRGLEHAGFVMVLHVHNGGASTATGLSAFSIHNFHLGFGRPGAMNDGGEQGETAVYDGSGGHDDLVERAFAGVVVARGLGQVAHHAASNAGSPPAANVFSIVDGGGTTDLPDLGGVGPTADGTVTAFQFAVGDLPAGGDAWLGVAFAHHGDPFATATAQSWLDAWIAGRSAQQIVNDELAEWTAFQNGVTPPAGLSADEETVLRQQAVMLAMAQSHEKDAFLRQWLATDGEPRYTRFGATPNGPPASLPATVAHKGDGAVVASLPPGEWTVAWSRDGAYAAAAMATLGLKAEAKAALAYFLDAEGGRFQDWTELQPYSMPPYQVSLVRYHGFGVEETDFNDFGPNLEFDGFGLFLWALRAYEERTGDTSLADARWDEVATKVGDVLVALVDPGTGLLRPDSSIWETHWNGRERTWTYTNVTAVRGLCDAAAIAERVGDTTRATQYKTTALALRAAVAAKLTDPTHALASNAEELAAGDGYYDAAVLDALAMGLFHPQGDIAKATLAALDQHLATSAGAGWSRNDDRSDHGGGDDLSPWGSEYDSAEWVVTDLRGAIATRRAGDTDRADRLLAWVRDQSMANYLAMAETYDESAGTYKFNAPMIGFGAGAWVLALADRAAAADPACGAYFDDPGTGGAGGAGDGGGGGSAGGAVGGNGSGGGPGWGGLGGDGATPSDDGGCGCRAAGDGDGGAEPFVAGVVFLALAALGRRVRRANGRV